MHRLVTGVSLPSAHGYVDISRFQFTAVADPAYTVSCDQRASGAKKAVEDQIPAGGAVEDCIGNQCNGFDGRVKFQQVALIVLLLRESANGWILPHVGAIPAKFAEHDIVAVSPFAVPKHEDEFVSRSVERPLAANILRPNANIEERVVNLRAGGEQLTHVLPIDTNEVD